MKKIASIALLLLTLNASGQGKWLSDYEVLDTAQYNFTYSLNWITDPDKPEDKKEDIHTLQIGKNMSKYYSKGYIDYMNFVVDYLKNNPNKPYPSNRKPIYNYEIFKNYPIGKITVTDLENLFLFNCYVYEDEVTFNWKIGEDTIEILGYKCQKATTTFRGRDYTAWFTTQIPVSDGPWKFSGLPGLIMKISDSENHYCFECIGIEQPQNETIKKYNRKLEKIKRTDLELLHRRKHKDFDTFIALYGWSGDASKPTPPFPYNPIELK